MDYKVSVFTCVYNRAHTIDRVFRSMKRQSYKNIEHIIVDDGSTDGIDELVAEYINTVKYPVKYIKKSNGGKHTAVNVAWDNAEGYFLFQLDSDDEVLPYAIQFLVDSYEEIPDEQKNDFWCVLGRCVDQKQKKLIGQPYPDGINSLNVEDAKRIANSINGDKVGLMVRDKLVGLRYPEPAFVNFVTESHLWYRLNNEYRTLYTNEPALIYYVNTGDECLSNPRKTFQVYANYSFNEKYELENRKEFGFDNKSLIRKTFLYSVYYELSTQKYKKHHSLFLSNSLVLNSFLLLLRLPVFVMRNKIIKRWGIEQA